MNSFYQRIKTLKINCLSILMLTSFSLSADNASKLHADEAINKLYHTLASNSKSDMAARVDIISASFLGKNYILSALGEGSHARFDQSPLYRVDGFDCQTYVDTVMALALADNLQRFKQCANKIRYLNGHVDFPTRNHFTDLDWNLHNQQQGFLRDITASFKDNNNQPVAKNATALIDKPSWYQHFKVDKIKLMSSDESIQAQRLMELKNRGNLLLKMKATIAYIPLTAFFDEHVNPNRALFLQIPNAAIIEIVRPNWDLRQQIGTCLNVSHLGFVFWKNGQLVFRQASSVAGKVIDIALIDYLKEALKSPTIKGINVQVIVPKKSDSLRC